MSSEKGLLEYKTKTESLFQLLREKIVVGDIRPGEALGIRKIARKYQVSETPVREALYKLKAEGLIELNAHKKAVVVKPSLVDIIDQLEVRALLQAEAALLSAPYLDEKDIQYLQELNEELYDYVIHNDYINYIKTNIEFHSIIYSKCPNQFLLSLIKDLIVKSERARAIFKSLAPSMKNSFSEHERIMEEIENGNFKELSEVEYNHQLRITKEFKDYFQENALQ